MDAETYLQLDQDIRYPNKSPILNITIPLNQIELVRVKKRGTFFLRQEINDYTPEYTSKCIIIYHILFAIIFLCFGITILTSNQDSYFEIRYDKCLLTNTETTQQCNLSLTINKTWKPPIYVYYKLENFFSNHHEYSKSKIFNQLRGKTFTESLYKSQCNDLEYNKDFFQDDETMKSYNGQKLNPNDHLNPCGLIAISFFNDTFELYDIDNTRVYISEKDIAYSSDVKYMYKRSENSEWKQWIDVENEHFMVWMNMELFPNFWKKWGRIENEITEGEYYVTINWNWDSTKWGVRKYFVISKGSTFGNGTFFGYALITGGVVSWMMILIIAISRCGSGNDFFEPDKMTWN